MLPESFTPALLRQLELLKVRSRRAFLGSRQGGHISPKRGHGIEFSDYRRYELGDNPRHIDWGVYARSERLYIKTFQEEQDLSVLIILDPTSSMHSDPQSKKWARACDIALAIAYVALMEQDTVRLAVPGTWISPSYYGPRAIHQLGESLRTLQPKEPQDFRREVQASLSRTRFPGVALFISDLLMPLKTLEFVFTLLRAKNFDITAIQVLGEEDINPLAQETDVIAVDSETGETIELSLNSDQYARYQFLLEEHNQHVRDILHGSGIGYIQARSSEPLGSFLLERLPATGLLK